MKKIIVICCLVLIGALFTALSASNNTQPPDTANPAETSIALDLSIGEMVRQSDTVAIGTCADARSTWVGRDLVTLATISVRETLKGEEASTITVVLPGGVDANRRFPIAMTYPGAPRITPSEDVFLFLTREDQVEGGFAITGFSQGKFSIVKDANGREMVSRDLTQTALKGKKGTRRGTVTQTPLADLKDQVMREVQK